MENNVVDDHDVGDIEQNICSPAKTTVPSTDDDGDSDDDELESSPEAATKSTTMVFVLKTIVYVVYTAPVTILYVIGCLCLLGEVKTPGECFRAKDKDVDQTRNARLYYRQSKGMTWEPFLAIAGRVGCLVLVWLLISLCIPGLKTATFLGVIHWKWSLLALLLSLGFPFAFFSVVCYITHFVDQAHHASYFLMGLFEGVMVLIYVLFIFLVWMLYFHHHLDTSSSGVDKYTTLTLASVLVGAFLLPLKDAVLYWWIAKVFFTKFRGRILMAGFRFYFLNLILDAKKIHKLLPLRNNIQDRISSQRVSTQQLRLLIGYLADIEKESMRDDDAQISAILDVYQQKIGTEGPYVTEEKIRELVGVDDADLLLEELKSEYPSMDNNQIPFQKWVVESHKSCATVRYMVADAMAMISVLNTILSWCLIGVVTLFWLLVTELATTKVLVVIGSPFLVLTFMFGDTCKTFFQGFIFAFVNHPFSIGDRCIIDRVEVEVKRVNIMTTTCLKIGTKETMLYPNSDLATKLIINLQDKPEPKDSIKLVLDSSTRTSEISNLEDHIKSFLNSDAQHDFFEKSCRVVVTEMENNIKIVIYFQHTMDIARDVSHSQFLEKKETQRSKLFMEIKRFLDEFGVKIATS